MPRLPATLARFRRDQTGITAVEYGLIIALIATVIFASVGALGTALKAEFLGLADKLVAANAAR